MIYCNYAYNNANWKDILTIYNGQAITYDAIVNPLTYRDGMSFTWANGHRLATFNKAGTNAVNATYTYNTDGIRTKKVVNGVTTDYYLNGSSIVTQISGSNRFDFVYDENGSLYGFVFNNTMYSYLRNAQNDIEAIVDDVGNIVVTYEYDPWGNDPRGNLISMTDTSSQGIGTLNPFRYRGYYYDVESGLFYVGSRYYDSNVGRFINADGAMAGIGSVEGCNLFQYCMNNPVNMSDPSGCWPIWVKTAVKVACIVAITVASCVAIGPFATASLSLAVNDIICDANFDNNSIADNNDVTSTVDDIVNDQNLATGQNFDFGICDASDSACEAIAIHNAKVLNGVDSSLSDTIKDVQNSGAMVAYGCFGSNPYMLGGILEDSGLSNTRVELNEMNKKGTYVISFWNDGTLIGGIHTVAVRYNGVNKYITFNLNGNGGTSPLDPSDYARYYICGYYMD